MKTVRGDPVILLSLPMFFASKRHYICRLRRAHLLMRILKDYGTPGERRPLVFMPIDFPDSQYRVRGPHRAVKWHAQPDVADDRVLDDGPTDKLAFLAGFCLVADCDT